MTTPDDVEEAQRLDSLSIDDSIRSQARHDARMDCANELRRFTAWLGQRSTTKEDITSQMYTIIDRWETT